MNVVISIYEFGYHLNFQIRWFLTQQSAKELLVQRQNLAALRDLALDLIFKDRVDWKIND